MSTKPPDLNELHRLVATREYRQIPNKIEMGIKITEDTHAKLRQLEQLRIGSRWQFIRAKRAKEAGREIGVPGRPRKLTKTNEQSLIAFIDNAYQRKTSIQLRELNQKV